MEITQAKLTLNNLIKSQTDELQATQLALDVLNNTFKADFVSLENAQKEANDKAAEVNAKNVDIATLNTTVTDLTSAVTEKDNAIEELSTTINEKQTALDDLSQQVQDATSLDDLKASLPIRITPPIKIDPIETIK
jgi:uncharacterized coiled-coil protein SlyX